MSRPWKVPTRPDLSRCSMRDLVRRLVAAEKALTWYANPKNWGDDDWGVRSVVQPPEYAHPGKKARRALRATRRAVAP